MTSLESERYRIRSVIRLLGCAETAELRLRALVEDRAYEIIQLTLWLSVAPAEETTRYRYLAVECLQDYDEAVSGIGTILTGEAYWPVEEDNYPVNATNYTAGAAQWVALDLLDSVCDRAYLALPAIMQFIEQTSEAMLKVRAIEVLGAIGPAAGEALPMLQRIAADDQESLRNAAKDAIKKIHNES
ncbi:MAG: hypothetical protein HYV27_18330 [Candidatus Hydrogenedentes bacterium]|nr:hypothetical protein [Candidatus Hydrogenedentota bacterium]